MKDTIDYAKIPACRAMPHPGFALCHWRKMEAINPMVSQGRAGKVLRDPEKDPRDYPDDDDKTAPRARGRRDDRTNRLSRGPTPGRL